MRLRAVALKMGWRKRTFPAIAGAMILGIMAVWQFLFPSTLNQYGNQLFDEFQRRHPREYVDMGVRVVNIDEESIRRFGQWPWPRPLIGELTKNLTDAGAIVVAYDVVFSEPDRTSPENVVPVLLSAGANPDIASAFEGYTPHDEMLGEIFANLPVVLGYFFERQVEGDVPDGCVGYFEAGQSPIDQVLAFRSATQSLPSIRAGAGDHGFLSIGEKAEGEDRFVRTAPLLAQIDGRYCPALSLSVLRYLLGGETYRIESSAKSGEAGLNVAPQVMGIRLPGFYVPTTGNGELWMNYTAGKENREIPAWKVLDPSYTAEQRSEWLKDAIVFVGAGAQGLNDLVATPVDSNLPGVFVHAQALEMMLLSFSEDPAAGMSADAAYLLKPDWGAGIRFAALVLGGIILILIIPITHPIVSGIAGAAMVGGMFWASWFFYTERGLLFDPVFPALGLLAVYGLTSLISFVVTEAEKSYIKDAFDHYLSPELVERIADDPSRLRLGGEERDMTILFSDIRSFSKVSEKMTPPELTSFLNRYLTPMTDILMARKATVDKYIGDAIMSFWNAPLDDPDQYKNAARAALDMMDKLDRMNALVGRAGVALEDTLPVTTKIGIGLHSGPTSVGNMGSEQRFAYSVLGDTVNIASRLEGMTKQYGLGILIGDSLAAHLADFAILEVDRAQAVGKDSWLTIFTLVGDEKVAADPAFLRVKDLQAEFLSKYRAKNFDEALTIADELALLGESFNLSSHYAIMKRRIEGFLSDPPPDDWNGIYVLREK